MSVVREDMENVLKVKINTLLQKIDSAHKQEDELKTQIRENYKQTHKEEKSVTELHAKLQALEETLRTKEKDNERLREKVREQQIEADCVDEFKERKENTDIHESFKTQQLRKEYGDLLITNNALKTTTNQTLSDITATEKMLRQEEALCEQEERRLQGLEKENSDITKRLESVLKLQEDIKAREGAQKEKIKALREKHAETEDRANKLGAEVKKMEHQLDLMSERLIGMKSEQDGLTYRMIEEKMRIDETLAKSMKNNSDTHKAMSIRGRKI